MCGGLRENQLNQEGRDYYHFASFSLIGSMYVVHFAQNHNIICCSIQLRKWM